MVLSRAGWGRSANRRGADGETPYGIVVTDASKFSQTSLVRVCGFEDVDMILTAGSPDPAAVEAVRESGVDLRILNNDRPAVR